MEDKPLIIQTDKTLLLEVDSPAFEACRNDITPFSELVKSPEHIHTYQISSISLWNAIGAGLDTDEIFSRLERWSKFPIPQLVILYIKSIAMRFGKLELVESTEENKYSLRVYDALIYRELKANKRFSSQFGLSDDETHSFLIDKTQRGNIKVDLIKLGYPVNDLIPFRIEERFPIELNPKLELRDYQKKAVDSVLGNGEPGTGYGTVVLPCGAGKTVVGIALMARLCTPTLVICPNIIAARQWITEILDKTLVKPEDIAEYSGEKKEIKSITVCTYQVLIHAKNKPDSLAQEMNNLEIIDARKWGLLLFDEVHLLPAPMFRFTASLQSAHRIGMTATLIREDGLETDVFSLIGPKRCDVPWSVLEQQGWIAEAVCTEVRIPLPEELAIPYAIGTRFEKNRIGSTNPEKTSIVVELLEKHRGEFILVIGQYLNQLKEIAGKIKAPLITGSMPNKDREKHFQDFREGKIQVLVVSRVANFAVDLPDASVAIQVSGIFGSRQEEAQRLGRILRPKERKSHFYSLITKYTLEEEFAANRQKFLVEQGYSYRMEER